MIRTLAAAAVLLTLTACGAVPSRPASAKPVPPGPPPPSMPDIPLVCPTETKLCPDGRPVGRNPANECEFDACSGSIPQ